LIRDLLFQVLSSKGYNVESAEAFSECLERLKSRTFDLVIAGTLTGDIQALIRRIRKAAPRTLLALIGELGNGDSSRRFPRASVDLVIGKPIDMGWTLNRISEILIGRTK
jgi:DNA-binding response OmpR family regulator